jgi:hypothetical protein
MAEKTSERGLDFLAAASVVAIFCGISVIGVLFYMSFYL